MKQKTKWLLLPAVAIALGALLPWLAPPAPPGARLAAAPPPTRAITSLYQADDVGAGAHGASLPYSPERFGAKRNGVTDDTTAIQNCINACAAAGGGTVQFAAGTYLVYTASLTFPNDGGTPPRQSNVILRGAGAHGAGQGAAPTTGTILDMRWHGTPAKIDTRGLGLLEITGITFKDGGAADGTPFIQTTNTTLAVHHCYFYGNTAGAASTQDAIVLGGTTTNLDGSATAAFQGYGTVVSQCGFNRVRTAVLGQTFANAVVVRDNCLWNGCGGDATHAGLQFAGPAANNTDAGVVLAGNLVEATNYVYCVLLDNANNCSLVGNNYYDPGAGTLAYVRLGAGATYNTIIHGYHSDLKPDVSDASNGTNTVLTSHQSQPSRFAQPVQFSNTTAPLRTVGGGLSVTTVGPGLTDTLAGGGNLWDWTGQYNGTGTGFSTLNWRYTSNARTVADLVTNGTTTVTSATAAFTNSDVARMVSGTNIPATTWVASVTNATTAVLNNAATGSGSGGALTIGGVTESLMTLFRATPQDYRLQLNAASTARLENTAGGLKLFSAGGNTVFLGDSTNNATITNGILTASKGLTAGKQALTYGTTVASSPASGAYMTLAVTDGVAFSMSAPGSATSGQEITYEILNSSGGAMGAITWNGAFKLNGGAAGLPSPAAASRRTISFKYNGSNWVETGRSAGDI